MIFVLSTIGPSCSGVREIFEKMEIFSEEWFKQVCKPKRILPWIVANVPRRQWNTIFDPRFSSLFGLMYYAVVNGDVKAAIALLLEAQENESRSITETLCNSLLVSVGIENSIIVKLMLASQVYSIKRDVVGNRLSLITLSLRRAIDRVDVGDGRNVVALLENGCSLDHVNDVMLTCITPKMRAVERSYIECRRVSFALLVLKKRQHRQEDPFLLWSKYDRFMIREIVKELWTMRTLWEGPIELPLTEKGLCRVPLRRTMVRYLRNK